MIALEFYGAATEVTGSCHILTVGNERILLDCGLIQGGRKQENRNRDDFPFRGSDISAVVLSHAHIDHSGRLPLLVRRGFKGPIHTQNATRDLVEILLRDGANLTASQTRQENRRREAARRPLIEPLYTEEDAAAAIRMVRGYRYRRWVDVAPGVKARFHDAGHIIGSAVVEVEATEGETTRRIVFSGDVGQYQSPILHDPQSLEHADVVLMESTYGDRTHKDRTRSVAELGELVREADTNRTNIVVPAFAVGRSQELLYHLGKHFDDWNVGRWQIFLDSPLAIQASEIYWDYPHLYDPEATRLRENNDRMPPLPNLHFTRTAAESKVIKKLNGGAIIIAGSGMCNGGRVLHHLKNNLGNPDARVLFTGYQAPGSLGRQLIEGRERVRIHGRTLGVQAKMATIGGLSAHGDRDDLIRWYRGFENRPDVYLVHGDLDAMQHLRTQIAAQAGARAHIPEPGHRLELS